MTWNNLNLGLLWHPDWVILLHLKSELASSTEKDYLSLSVFQLLLVPLDWASSLRWLKTPAELLFSSVDANNTALLFVGCLLCIISLFCVFFLSQLSAQHRA